MKALTRYIDDGELPIDNHWVEDRSKSIALGRRNWCFAGSLRAYWDKVMGRSMNGPDGKDRELVLGRRTYEIFEAYWPYQPADSPIAQALNAARKHVASRTPRTLDWNNSTLRRSPRGSRGAQVGGRA